MERSLAIKLTLACGVATAMLVAITLGACDSDSGSPAVTCKLGGACSPSQVCAEGIVGCESDCQCVSGTWQSPCPAGMPQSGSSCKAEGANCGYPEKGGSACNANIDCDCRGGAWTCRSSCYTPPDAGPDAAQCLAAGGECFFQGVICAVPSPLACNAGAGFGSYCCMSNVPDCGQPSATTYACPPAEDGGLTCTSAPIPLGAPNSLALEQEATESDAAYPVGCRVTFPACNNGHVPYCTCTLEAFAPTWDCFN